MCVSQLVMQDWHENFIMRIKQSRLFEHLGGLYVDDGRNMLDVLQLGHRFVKQTGTLEYSKTWEEEDMKNNRSKQAGAKLGHTRVFSHVNLSLIWSKLV